MITPEKLKKGDKVGIISTARKISLDELIFSIKIIENWGMEVVLGENVIEVGLHLQIVMRCLQG